MLLLFAAHGDVFDSGDVGVGDESRRGGGVRRHGDGSGAPRMLWNDGIPIVLRMRGVQGELSVVLLLHAGRVRAVLRRSGRVLHGSGAPR